MSRQSAGRDNPLGRLLVTAAIGWALWAFPLDGLYDPLLRGLWWFGAFCVAVGVARSIPNFSKATGNLAKLFRAYGRDDTKGSAGLMPEREVRQKGLHRRRRGTRFCGIVGGTALWLGSVTSHLILGPSSSMKTTAAIMLFLMGCRESALITDIKGELYATTAAHRRKAFRHRIVLIDPTRPDESAKINPLDLAWEALERGDPAALTFIRGMVRQMYPDPTGGGGANEVFYRGARILIVAVIFAILVVMPREHRNLATVFRALSDLDLLHDLLDAATKSDALSGEVADMARSQHAAFFSDDGNQKTAESFRINALQALDSYGPGGYLAPITSETTFRFSELKTGKVSVYIVIDFANSEVLGSFAGLMQWLAADAMVKSGNNKPVLFILDEFCNAPLYILPKILTLLRSAGVRCIMATQDLDDIVRVYSKHALETVLSESFIKQFLGGIRSKSTLEYVSSYMGEYSEVSGSYAMRPDGIQESVSRTNRRVLTEDEIRRLPPDASLLFYGSEKPILAKKVQVFAISNWRTLLKINRLYGNKRKLLPVEVRIRWFGTEVTGRGQRAYRKMAKKVHRPSNRSRRIVGELLKRFLPGPGLLVVAVIAAALYTAGLPNLRWEVSYARGSPTIGVQCRYVGPTSPGTIAGPNCPAILWRRTW